MKVWSNPRQRRDHRFAQENLSAYLDGELAAGETARVEAHLRRCPACQRELHALRQTALLLRRAPRPALPRSFVLPASAAGAQARYRRWQVGYGLVRAASVAVALLLVALLSTEALLSAGLVSLPTRQVAREQTRLVAVALPEAAPVAAPASPETLPADRAGVSAAPEMQPLAAAPDAAPAEEAPLMAFGAGSAPAEQAPEPQDEPIAALAAPPAVADAPVPAAAPAPTVGPEIVFAAPGAGGAAPEPSALGGAGGAGGPAAGGMGAGGDAGAAPDSGAAGEGEGPALVAAPARPTPPLDSSAVKRVMAPTPTEAPAAAPEQAPLAEPTAPPVVAAAQPPSQPEPTAPALAATRAPETRVERYTVVTQEAVPAAWRLWRALRLAAGGLLGLLLMLVASLLWLRQRKPL